MILLRISTGNLSMREVWDIGASGADEGLLRESQAELSYDVSPGESSRRCSPRSAQLSRALGQDCR